jgi:hypothetical protein
LKRFICLIICVCNLEEIKNWLYKKFFGSVKYTKKEIVWG